jgi:predicted peptidase
MKKIIFLLLVCFCIQSIEAQLSTIVGKTGYPFWINLPDNHILNNKPPLLIFLHGRSLSGTDLNRVKRYGVIKEIEKGRKIPAIVIAPQLTSGPWNAPKILELIEYIEKNYNIDSTRIYVCGMSLGGYGTLEVAAKYPNRIAAGVAICGGGNVNDACNLAKVPLWIQHGDKDVAVPISQSKKIVEAIRKCDSKADLTFTIIKGASHGSVERLFHENALYDWLFSYSLKK